MATTESSDKPKLRSRGTPFWLALRERIIEYVLFGCGFLSVLVTVTIAGVVVYNSFLFFTTEGGETMPFVAEQEGQPSIVSRVTEFFTGTEWTAGFDNPKYGIWPLLTSTLWVTFIAALISIPIGLATAIYLSEYATPRVRGFAKPVLEVLAGIPTVVYGFFAIMTITPFLSGFDLKDWPVLNLLPSWGVPEVIVIIPGLEPFNLIGAGIVVGIMIIPMVASLSEDALRAVPKSLRDGAYALGATKFEVSTQVVVPSGLSGVAASFILAISRAVGETMAVAMAAGERFNFTFDPREGAATMTGFIVRAAKGDNPYGTTYYFSLFAVAGTLFFMTLALNIVAQWITRRFRQVYQ